MRRRGKQIWGGVDLEGLRQTADRLSQAALILHSPVASWSPPAASLLSLATCLSENNTAPSKGSAGRDKTPTGLLCHLSGFQRQPSPPTPVLCCGRGQAAHRARLVTRVCCRYQERSAQRPVASRSWYGSHQTGLSPLGGATCMDAPWPRLSAGFSF